MMKPDFWKIAATLYPFYLLANFIWSLFTRSLHLAHDQPVIGRAFLIFGTGLWVLFFFSFVLWMFKTIGFLVLSLTLFIVTLPLRLLKIDEYDALVEILRPHLVLIEVVVASGLLWLADHRWPAVVITTLAPSVVLDYVRKARDEDFSQPSLLGSIGTLLSGLVLALWVTYSTKASFVPTDKPDVLFVQVLAIVAIVLPAGLYWRYVAEPRLKKAKP